MIYVLHYDRALRETLTLDEFPEADVARADARRADLETQFRERTGQEIVTLTSANLATLRMTHSRYFLTDDEIVAAVERCIT